VSNGEKGGGLEGPAAGRKKREAGGRSAPEGQKLVDSDENIGVRPAIRCGRGTPKRELSGVDIMISETALEDGNADGGDSWNMGSNAKEVVLKEVSPDVVSKEVSPANEVVSKEVSPEELSNDDGG
jgi:hypothetical protein